MEKNFEQKWWHKSVVYQIYPKSFNDTTGSGQGDIKGITEKLDYLKKLGVEVLWLTPMYKSPQNDNGYDISDYYSIDESYGTMEDFEEMLREAHKRDIKIVMDIVVNHTSTENEWFKKSEEGDPEYKDFYIWKDAVNGKEPTNWQSKFGGNAWKWSEKRKQYYLHLFDVTQADLNWKNEKVRKKVYEMIKYWLNKGVDGFRFDVINLISKDQRFLNDDGSDTRFVPDGRRFYTDGPKIHEYLKEIHKEAFGENELLTVGEMSSTSLENCVRYSNPQEKELSMAFSFHHLKVDYPNGEKWVKAPFDFVELKRILSKWQIGMYEGNGWNATFWTNHDQPRALSRFGDDKNFHEKSGKMLATVLHGLQGTPYVYQGEEFGMTNPYFDKIEKYQDVESKNMYKILRDKGLSEEEVLDILMQKSRDNSRTPVQWDDTKNAGFTSGTPWIGIPENYKKINAENALKDNNSIFYHYQNLIQLRRTEELLITGRYEDIDLENKKVYAYKRIGENEELIVISNFYDEVTEFDVKGLDLEKAFILLSNYVQSPEIKEDKIILKPYESIIFKKTK
ncbi:alpha,alpha-phosphotrehalase [Leptotrichia sp. oral taxon 218]|jgi:alpha,alpha-phosphotrehalase|uniref:alpha,alpha-phosphotrehalase n=1 Tax=Leptotrichia sp. oral taxon 218 TaxID=712361 RepID=UPI001B8D902C|nr:alpha,alpha-phosphotrehalase [Leptotrichia sp. oral taxon 218]QUB94989.1 alpha,alpha-phosphotrehalase [Leptotrichia sp. oral taxon 218]